MRYRPAAISPSPVALRKESVDRNIQRQKKKEGVYGSLSARRAWIEIGAAIPQRVHVTRRSPQGERG